MGRTLLATLAILALAGAARAEVVDKGAYGFRLKSVQQVAAPPEAVFKALGEVGRWWSDAHTYSGKAANMTMPLTPNACFCGSLKNARFCPSARWSRMRWTFGFWPRPRATRPRRSRAATFGKTSTIA